MRQGQAQLLAIPFWRRRAGGPLGRVAGAVAQRVIAASRHAALLIPQADGWGGLAVQGVSLSSVVGGSGGSAGNVGESGVGSRAGMRASVAAVPDAQSVK